MSNKPITSREFKLMLKTDRFSNRDAGSGEFMDLVAILIENQGGEVTKDFEEKERRVWYLDTPAFALRQKGFILRLRREMEADKQFKLTLKYRHPDRYLASNSEMAVSPMAEDKYREDDDDIETKFEEDILRASVSKLAHSTSIRMNGRPVLNTLADAIDIFPGLETLPIPDNTPIAKVNGFTAQEIKRESGKIDFDMKPRIKPCLSFWYLTDETTGYPLVTEFSFDYDVSDEERERLIKKPNRLEQFPLPLVENADIFFKTIQGHLSWLDLAGSTKTAFAYTI